jgi:hypothetical protein
LGFRNFSGHYRARYGQDPVRTATLAYDAVARRTAKGSLLFSGAANDASGT